MGRNWSNIPKFACLLSFAVVLLVPWHQWLAMEVSLGRAGLGPSLDSPLGFDNMGRDLLGRLSLSLKYSLPLLWLVAIFSVVMGWILGAVLCLWEEGKGTYLLTLLDYCLGLISGIPIFLMVFAFAILFDVMGMKSLLVSVGLILMFNSCFQLRCLFKSSQKLGYWDSHRSIGGEIWKRIIFYGFCHEWKSILLSSLCWAMNIAIICEVSLSYLGFGVQEPNPSLGNILSSHFSEYLHGNMRVLLVVVGALTLIASAPYFIKDLVSYWLGSKAPAGEAKSS